MRLVYKQPVTTCNRLEVHAICASGVATVQFGIGVDTEPLGRAYIE